MAQTDPAEVEAPALPLTTIHDALALASQDTDEHRGDDERFTIRLPGDVKSLVKRVCEDHATTASAYLRQCCIALAKDYGGKS
jgi:hypothetical protein